MQTGIIQRIEETWAKKDKKPRYVVMLEDGIKITTFDPHIKKCRPGDCLNYDVKIITKGWYLFVELQPGWYIDKGQ